MRLSAEELESQSLKPEIGCNDMCCRQFLVVLAQEDLDDRETRVGITGNRLAGQERDALQARPSGLRQARRQPRDLCGHIDGDDGPVS